MGNFIPKTYRKLAITLRIDEKMLADIDHLSKRHGMSRSEVIGQCIEYALADLNSGDESEESR